MMSSSDKKPEPSQFFRHPEWLGFHHDGYQVVPLAQYLEIRRKDRPSSREETAEARSREVAASTQSLLTFGLLEAVIEQHVPESILVKENESGKLFMTREGLVEIIRSWVDRIKRGRQEMLKPWLERIHTSLRQAHSLLVGFTKSQFTVFNPLGDDASAMVCLIALVGEALVKAKMGFPSGLPQQGFSWSMVWVPPYTERMMEERVADGWCRSTVEYLIRTSSVSSLEYASECGPIEDGKHHGACSVQSCATYIVDIKTYTPKHALSCKSSKKSSEIPCKYSKPSFEEIEQYILGEGIPVITLANGPDDISVNLQVHRASDIPYVAISHVWADGLGSTTEVGLPTCQLRRLASLTSKIRPGAAFWTDSICIPEARHLRKKAIAMMARTYSEAVAVLVLDGGLQRCYSTEPRGVKILRVLTSGWMRRLWTLQEAVLSKELHLVFADAQLLLKDLMPTPNDMLLFPHLTDLAGELFRLIKLSSYGSYSIGDIARSLQWRTTNRPPDETLAIASLLGAKPAVFVDLDPEQRMMRLIQHIGKLPRNVLFLPGAKLQFSGFRWAPKSFMAAHSGSAGGSMLSTQAVDAVLTASGLEATYYALIFPRTTFGGGKPWKLKDQKANRVYEVRDLSSGTGSYTCDMLLLLERIPAGNASSCVGVLRNLGLTRVEKGGSYTAYCEYQRRLVISDEVVFKDHLGDIVFLNASGKLSACVG